MSWGQIKEWKYDTWQLDTLGNQHHTAIGGGRMVRIMQDSIIRRRRTAPLVPSLDLILHRMRLGLVFAKDFFSLIMWIVCLI